MTKNVKKRKLLKRLALFIAGTLAIIAGCFVLELWYIGEFKTIYPVYKGIKKRDKIFGIVGGEDLTIHPNTGMAFISSCDRRALLAGRESPGAIYGYDLKAENPVPVNLTPELSIPFHPHGLSLYIGEDAQVTLMVVNHRSFTEHFVEIFDYRDNVLVHRESLRDDQMHSPNDLVAVGPRSFYVTNDHASTSNFGRLMEDFLLLARTNVLYYDGEKFTQVAEGIAYANGINLSPDGKTLYVASPTGLKVNVYERTPSSGALRYKTDIPLNTGADNIEIDSDGNLWIAGHPKLFTFFLHMLDSEKLAPSQVVKVTPTAGGYQRETVYLDSGAEISGASVATVFENKLLIGPVFDDHILFCTVE